MSDNPHGLKMWRHWFNMETEEGRRFRRTFLGKYTDALYYDNGHSNLPMYYETHAIRNTPMELIISKVEQIDNDDWEIYCSNLMRHTWEAPDWVAEPIDGHYAHVKRQEDGQVLISFISSPEHGKRGRLTVMKPGKYLTRYHTDFSADEVRSMVADLDKALEVSFAVTAEEIEAVYTNGPESCMSYKASHFNSKVHPTAVYGDSDLQVAYLKKRASDRVTARTLVWPDKKVYARGYGDELRLNPALEALGYRKVNSLRGASVRLIWHNEGKNQIVMPYIDGTSEAKIDGDMVTLGSGYIMCQTTCGIAETDPGMWCSYSDQYWPEDQMVYCTDDGEYYHESALNDGYLWRDNYTGDNYRRTTYQITTEDGSTYHRQSFERLDGYLCSGTDEYHVSRTSIYSATTNAPIVLKDTEETVCPDYAEEHCVEIDGVWYSEAPESPEESSESVSAPEVAEITEMAA